MNNRQHIVIFRPQGFVHAESWREAIDAVRYGLNELGFDVHLTENRIEPGTKPIIFGAHHLADGQGVHIPPGSVVFNLEQLLPGYPWYSKSYLSLLSSNRVWDFSSRNVAHLLESGVNTSAVHVPLGYVQEFSRIEPRAEDVDVLFYGLISERRKVVLEALANAGLRVVVLTSRFGEERDQWISRSRVVLNMRYAEGGLFESLRVLYLLANRKAVVSELDNDEISSDLRAGMVMARYEDLVQTCVDLVNDAERCKTVAEAGFQAVLDPRRRMSATLRGVLQVAGLNQ